MSNEHLKATLGLDNRPFAQALRGAKGMAMDFQHGMQRIGQIMAASFFAGLVKKSIDFAATIKDVSDTTGIATGTLQAFRQKASEAAGGVEVVDKALEKFTVTVGNARDGDIAASRAFDELGVSLSDAGGAAKTNEELFQNVSDALGNIKDPAERARLAVDIFGKTGIKLSTSFEGGSAALKEFQAELTKTGVILDESAIAKLDNYDARLKRFSNSVQVAGSKTVSFIGGLAEKAGTFFGTLSADKTTGTGTFKDFEIYAGVLSNAINSIGEIEMENLKVAAKRLATERELTTQVEKTAAAKRMEAEEAKKATLEAISGVNKRRDESMFQTPEEIVQAGAAGKMQTRQQMIEVEQAKLVLKYRQEAEKYRGINPDAAREFTYYADIVESRINSLAASKKKLGDQPIQTNAPKTEADTGSTMGGLAGGIEAAVKQAYNLPGVDLEGMKGAMTQRALFDKQISDALGELVRGELEQRKMLNTGIVVIPKNGP